MIFKRLQDWQDAQGVSDTELGEDCGCHGSTIGRAKHGLRTLNMAVKLNMQRRTGITLSEWAEFEAKVVLARVSAKPRKPTVPKAPLKKRPPPSRKRRPDRAGASA